MLKEEKSSTSSSSRPDTKCIWSKEEDRLLVESMMLFENHRQQVLYDCRLTTVDSCDCDCDCKKTYATIISIDDETSHLNAVIPPTYNYILIRVYSNGLM